MRRSASLLAPLLASLLWPGVAAAQAVSGTEITSDYAVYAAGLNTARLHVALAFAPASYRLRLGYRTAGLFGVFFHAESSTLAEGAWQGGGAAPRHFAATGRFQGVDRQTVIDYAGGQPIVRTLLPPNDGEREAVPSALRQNTIDTLSAMALLLRDVQASGGCEAHAVTFDGRRLIDVTAHTAGVEVLPRSGRSAFFGPALRCDFEGRQLAGFRRADDQAELRRPKHGSAWLAQVLPGAPPIPIRLSFETRWFGMATLYLTATRAGMPAAIAGARPKNSGP